MGILLVEDDPTTSRSIELMLSNAGFNVYATDLGEEGKDLALLYDYDLILLDLGLPDMSGHEVLRQLRAEGLETPIMILSGADDTENKLKGFGFGADDYMTKPFHREELVARINAIIRRSKGSSKSIISTGLIDVNLDAKTVEVGGAPVHLTGNEYQMLELLSLRKGTTLTKEMFFNHLYGGMDKPELKIIDVFIAKLRMKLSQASGGENYIETVWGRGYRLLDPSDDQEPAEPRDNAGAEQHTAPDETLETDVSEARLIDPPKSQGSPPDRVPEPPQPDDSPDAERSKVPAETLEADDATGHLPEPPKLGGGTLSDLVHADAMPAPMLWLTPKGEILRANRRAQELLEIGQTSNLNFSDVVEALGRPVDEWLLDVSEGRYSGRAEIGRATRPSHDVYLQVSLGRTPAPDDEALLAVLFDATELKTLEAQFVQSQKMQAIGQLAGGVAHDFNNLLTAISGHCDLLLLRHDPGDPDYADLMQINQNANRAASLVGQLLAFSRKQNMQPELIDLRDVLGDLTHLLNRVVSEKIELSFRHDRSLPHIRADKRELEQILMNLVVNARDAMPQGGAIRIDTRAVRLAEPLHRDRASVPRGDYVLVRVEDEGCGIAPDKLLKIFEPFFSTKPVGEGTGLGLSMVYGVVRQSGGYIFVDSVVGEGSVFTMYFPAHQVSETASPPPPAAKEKTVVEAKGKVVLLAEDEAPVRAFAGRALRLHGFTVYDADSGEDALETLENVDQEFDIFVSDVVMPGMDGPQWVAQALEKCPNAKVVFVSGYAEDSFAHSRAKIPNSVFLPKPFSLNQLVETVEDQLR